MSRPDFMQEADEQSQAGDAMERAQVMAMLAIAEAIRDLADEIRGMGTIAHPIYHSEQ